MTPEASAQLGAGMVSSATASKIRAAHCLPFRSILEGCSRLSCSDPHCGEPSQPVTCHSVTTPTPTPAANPDFPTEGKQVPS